MDEQLANSVMAYQKQREQIKAQTDDARKNDLKNQIIQK